MDSRGCRHVLLLGGLPSREPGRSIVLIEIEQALRRGGNTRLIASTLRKSCGADFPDPARDRVRELLTMIELTFPGLVDVAVSSGGCSR
ncbi:hypothetical protein LOK46_27705 [Methylobacterium sp. NMS14P]|uniref:hypothetical protein n=1 Tax=Methylobacterium sp. NMS14P TaxID=2894310 RepID=UPI002359A7A6|nr:hypothetical protein [Methylobacterium sp. NMS14P]WCS24869.1 hypothetical protein LOK46_27705 [Methylobacterium sp. NMS14P]